jgi:hypothetical protein
VRAAKRAERDDRVEPHRAGVAAHHVNAGPDRRRRVIRARRGEPSHARRRDAHDAVELRDAVAAAEEVDVPTDARGGGVVESLRQRADRARAGRGRPEDPAGRAVRRRQAPEQQRAPPVDCGRRVLQRRTETARHVGGEPPLGRAPCGDAPCPGNLPAGCRERRRAFVAATREREHDRDEQHETAALHEDRCFPRRSERCMTAGRSGGGKPDHEAAPGATRGGHHLAGDGAREPPCE